MSVYKEGWCFGGFGGAEEEDLVYFPSPTDDEFGYTSIIGGGLDQISIWKSADRCDDSSVLDYTLTSFFEDYLKPTESERILFEVEFSFPYPKQSLLNKYRRLQNEQT